MKSTHLCFSKQRVRHRTGSVIVTNRRYSAYSRFRIRKCFYNRFTMGNKNRARNLSYDTCSFLGLARDASCVARYENRVARDENRVARDENRVARDAIRVSREGGNFPLSSTVNSTSFHLRKRQYEPCYMTNSTNSTTLTHWQTKSSHLNTTRQTKRPLPNRQT